MNKKTQYQQNFDIINKFFKKPITLITGIFAILSSFTFTVAIYYCSKNAAVFLNYISNSFKFLFSDSVVNNLSFDFFPSIIINIFPLLFGLSFIILHFFSEDKGSKVHSVSKFYRIISLILMILSIFNTCAILFVSFVLFFLFPTRIILFVAIAILILSGFFFTLNYSRFRFAKSINRSVNSIYLNKKGSVLFAVCNFLIAIFFLPFFLILLSTYFLSESDLFFSLLPLSVFLFVFIAEKILWAVTAIKYSRYIQGVIYGKIKVISDVPVSDFETQITKGFLSDDQPASSDKVEETAENHLAFSDIPETSLPESNFSFNTSPVSVQEEPKDGLVDYPLVMDNENVNSPDPIVDFNNTFETEVEPETTDVSFSPDLFSSTNNSETFSCPDCGAPFTDEDFFCNVCGRKLI